MNDSSPLTVPARLWRNGDILTGTLCVSASSVAFLSPSGSPLLDGGEIPPDALEAALPYNTFLFVPNGLILHLKDGSTIQFTLERRREILARLRELNPAL